jgi:hypothetical protein
MVLRPGTNTQWHTHYDGKHQQGGKEPQTP